MCTGCGNRKVWWRRDLGEEDIFGWFTATKINTLYTITNNCDLIHNLVITAASWVDTSHRLLLKNPFLTYLSYQHNVWYTNIPTLPFLIQYLMSRLFLVFYLTSLLMDGLPWNQSITCVFSKRRSHINSNLNANLYCIK